MNEKIYTKMIRPIDIVGKSENEKIMYLKGVMNEAYNKDKSLIIIDDVDIMMNFMNVGESVSISSYMWQMMKTVMRSRKEGKEINIVCTTRSDKLTEIIGSDFDEVYNLK